MSMIIKGAIDEIKRHKLIARLLKERNNYKGKGEEVGGMW
jgi:hypothetical protein